MFGKLKCPCPGIFAWGFVFVALLLAMTACGQKGDLYLPAPPAETADQAADQNKSS